MILKIQQLKKEQKKKELRNLKKNQYITEKIFFNNFI